MQCPAVIVQYALGNIPDHVPLESTGVQFNRIENGLDFGRENNLSYSFMRFLKLQKAVRSVELGPKPMLRCFGRAFFRPGEEGPSSLVESEWHEHFST